MKPKYYVALLLLFTIIACATPRDAVKDVAVQHQGSGNTLIVLLGGSEGGFLEAPPLIDDLLTAGFATMQVAYFKFPGGPRSLSLIDVNAVADAIRIEAEGYDCVGLLGVSKGAELALVLAAYDSVADATVATVPSHVVWNASRINPVSVSSWVLHGEPMPYLAYDTLSVNAVRAALNPENAKALHMDALSDVPDEAFIPIERIKTPVFLQTSLHDQIWPSNLMGAAALSRAYALAPNNEITLKAYDFDHYLLWYAPARADLIGYFNDQFHGC